MVVRAPIETWSRPQLEDNYHQLAEQLQAALKKNRESEKQLQQFNSRLRRNLLARKERDETLVEREKFDEVVKENQLLLMKLKAAKHQLLIYTAPSARAATASALTGRSTFRPPTWRRQPATGQSVMTDRPIDDSKSQKAAEAKLQLSTDEKLMIVRLNRTLKSRNQQISDLQFAVDKLKTKLGELRKQNESVGSGRSSDSAHSAFSELSDSGVDAKKVDKEPEKKNRAPKKDKEERRRAKDELGVEKGRNWTSLADSADSKKLVSLLRLAEQDVQVLRSENNVLKDANERLVQQSLSRDYDMGAKEQIELKKQIVQLEEKLKDAEQRLRDVERRRKDEQHNFEKWKRQREKMELAAPAPTPQPAVVESSVAQRDRDEPESRRSSSSRNSRRKHKKDDDDLLMRLYNDVAGILNAHDLKTDDVIGENLTGTQKIAKWQKMYAELYEELEKVRNLLLVQHSITQKQNAEIRLLSDELLRVKTLGEENLQKLREKIEEKQKKVFLLEEQIRAIAYSGQAPIPLRAAQENQPELATQLSVRLAGVTPVATLKAPFFFSLEFFDFQLETTPILQPRAQPLDFTTVYDIVVSNLFVHYLQSNGITIEMYRPQGTSYELMAAGVISLTSLLSDQKDQKTSKYSAELSIKTLDTGKQLATLKYEIAVSKSLGESFSQFQRSEKAQMLLPLETNLACDPADFDALIVNVNRCAGLANLKREGTEVCVVYELLSFSPFFTDVVSTSTGAEFDSHKDWLIPRSTDIAAQFAHTSISFYLLENGSGGDGVLAMLSLPMTSLARNSSIKGSFSMLLADGNDSGVTLDVSILWKYGTQARTGEKAPVEQPPIGLAPVPVRNRIPETPVLESSPRRSSSNESSQSSSLSPEPFTVPAAHPTLPPLLTPPRRTTVVQTTSVTMPTSPAASSDTFSPQKPTPMVWEVETEVTPRTEWQRNDDGLEEVSVRSSKSDSDRLHIEEELVHEEKTPSDRSSASQTTVAPAEKPGGLQGDGQHEAKSDELEAPPSASASTTSSDSRSRRVEEVKSLLGDLPPIAKPRSLQPANRRRFRRRVDAKEDPSTFPSAAEEAQFGLPRLCSEVSMIPVEEDDETADEDAIVTLFLDKLEVIEYSRLLVRYFDNVKVYIDWMFLDFPVEESRTRLFSLPRDPAVDAELKFKKEYRLSRRRIALLEQWVELGNRVDFTIVVEGADEEELAVAQLPLYHDPVDDVASISFLDVNGEHMAELHLSLYYEPTIFDKITS